MELGAIRRDPCAPVGFAHVATVSFLASRVSPSGAFVLALAGGIAVARAAAVYGWRIGYGASLAAMLQTTVLMGPARFNGPLTQAMTAPLLGYLYSRGTSLGLQLVACLAIRLTHYAVLLAAFVWIILGGLDAFTGSYEALTGWLGFLPQGTSGALIVTASGHALGAVMYTTVQVLVYRRALRTWPRTPAPVRARITPEAQQLRAPRFDPRAIALAATVAFVILLAVPTWQVLTGVAAWLLLSSVVARPETEPLRLGLALTALLALSAFTGALLADLGMEEAARRATRAALLVVVATWLRAAAGADGLREVFARGLRWLRWVPAVREAQIALGHLDPRASLAAAARELIARVGDVPVRPLAIADAVVEWVAAEAAGAPRKEGAGTAREVRLRVRDLALVALAVAPVLTLVG